MAKLAMLCLLSQFSNRLVYIAFYACTCDCQIFTGYNVIPQVPLLLLACTAINKFRVVTGCGHVRLVSTVDYSS